MNALDARLLPLVLGVAKVVASLAVLVLLGLWWRRLRKEEKRSWQ